MQGRFFGEGGGRMGISYFKSKINTYKKKSVFKKQLKYAYCLQKTKTKENK